MQMQKDVVSSDMINLMNMGYEGEFWFGNPSQKMQVIFDTGSAWAWVFSEKCKSANCPVQNKKYLQSKSSEYHNNEKTAQMLQYGKGAIIGHPSTDRACFGGDNKHCLDQLSFLTVIKAADISSLKGSGLIGLAPTPDKGDDQFNDPLHKGVPGFVAQLKHSAAYEKDFDPVFSFYLSNDTNEKGKMIFGGTDYEKFAEKGLGE